MSAARDFVGDGDLCEVNPPPSRVSMLKLFTLDEVLDRPRAPWAVHKVIRRGELVGIYAEPAAGKTLVALLLSLSFASGSPWFGYRVQGGPVVYLAGEGTVGLGNRLRAALLGMQGGRDALLHTIHFMLAAIEFLSDQQFGDLLTAINALKRPPVLIIIDPLARFMGDKDENLACDMGLFIQRCGRLVEMFGATVMVLHHAGKDGTRERGSTAWRAAMDVVLRISRDDRTITVRGEKAKDAEELPPTYAEIKPEWLGLDEFDEPLHSVRLVQKDQPENAQADAEEPAKVDPTVAIRKAIAHLGEPSPAELIYATAGVSRTRFYLLVGKEEEAGRVLSTKPSRTRLYELTLSAPEYVDPVERPVSRPAWSHGTDGGTDPLGSVPSQSRPAPPPRGAVGRDGRTGSANENFAPQQKRKVKRARAKSESNPSPGKVREPVESACSIRPLRPDQEGGLQ